jgi:hypothetical protein
MNRKSRARTRPAAKASPWRARLIACMCTLGSSVLWAAPPMSLEQLLHLPLERLLELKVAPIRISQTTPVQVAQVGGPSAEEGGDVA